MTRKATKPLVLIIDDDPRVREGLARRLRSDEFGIATASCGEEALPLIKSMAVAVAICDETMPGQAGIGVLKLIRDVSPQTVRIMLTGAPSTSLAMRAINAAGVSHFLTKPCDAAEISRIVRHAVSSYSTAQAAKTRRAYESRIKTAKVYELAETTLDTDEPAERVLEGEKHLRFDS
jgi:two-component system probable response regulator PhcQ